MSLGRWGSVVAAALAAAFLAVGCGGGAQPASRSASSPGSAASGAESLSGYWVSVAHVHHDFDTGDPFIVKIVARADRFLVTADGRVIGDSPLSDGRLAVTINEAPARLQLASGELVLRGSGVSTTASRPPTYRRIDVRGGAVVDGVLRIVDRVSSWAVDHGDTYPPPDVVSQKGLAGQSGGGRYVRRWPDNPYTGEPMRSGQQPGDYQYAVDDSVSGFAMAGLGDDSKHLVTVDMGSGGGPSFTLNP